MTYSIALVPGDGIGPDVTNQAVEVLDAVGDSYGHVFNYVELLAGGCAIDATGEPLPASTVEAAKDCDAVLLGAVGGPQWENLPGHLRPERALLGLRSALDVYANLRPAALLPQLKAACPLKDEVVGAGFDLLIVRELTGGLYFGERGRSEDGESAFDTERYSKREIERVLRAGYRAAATRRKKLCVVDKANVLESSRLWREVAAVVAKDYPDIETSYLYVDNCAMQLIRAPGQFDVIVTSNLFGDILSDEASVLTGSIGMLASASLGDPSPVPAGAKATTMGLYEPIHGSAPDIAGKDLANPLAAILSAAMLLRHSFGLEKEARAIEAAVSATLDAGFRTKDIASRGAAAATVAAGAAEEKIVGTLEMGKRVLEALAAGAAKT
ncbi:MAG TPA: 3-isopropylmalate dehydrogenase [Treponema sp.]|nr:MAG: 3-isopropylmalate dehydrogenase [Treponema sp. GWC1_61_84]OHE76878.1 MAG: 3-isopropylmalate dehydrogenase [Treponema sp. RIFOXYC1_FULL_61_9]HCM26133.1 3-isopropylmalate dehydrogenase [Treponema sp.]